MEILGHRTNVPIVGCALVTPLRNFQISQFFKDILAIGWHNILLAVDIRKFRQYSGNIQIAVIGYFHFDNAGILFTDISGFVALARQLGPARTVTLLNEIVTEFDKLAEAHGVEKIKTIGDAYMAAAGIPDPVPNPTARLARLAIDMQKVITRIRDSSEVDISMRVGLASGPVMAGVIGKRKFTYDVWGDTVNLAARLENKSTPGRILVCPACRDQLEPDFRLESHGVIDIKGVGAQETWFLLGETASPQEPAEPSAAPDRRSSRPRQTQAT